MHTLFGKTLPVGRAFYFDTLSLFGFVDLGLKSEDECQSCPAGYYCSQAGANTTSGLCAPGYYCPEGSVTEQQELCPEGKYCPLGSEAPELCPIGTYQPNKRQEHINDCLPCTEGMDILNRKPWVYTSS